MAVAVYHPEPLGFGGNIDERIYHLDLRRSFGFRDVNQRCLGQRVHACFMELNSNNLIKSLSGLIK